MNFSQAISSFYGKTFDFTSRSSRSEYWFPFFFNSFITLLLCVLAEFNNDLAVLILIFWAIILVPTLSLRFRRYHDLGKSGLYPVLLVYLPRLAVLISLISDIYTEIYYEDSIFIFTFALTLIAVTFPFDLYFMMMSSREDSGSADKDNMVFLYNSMSILSLIIFLVMSLIVTGKYANTHMHGYCDPRPYRAMYITMPVTIVFIILFIAIRIRNQKSIVPPILTTGAMILSICSFKMNYHFSSQEHTNAGYVVEYMLPLGVSIMCAFLLLYFIISYINSRRNKPVSKYLCFTPFISYSLLIAFIFADGNMRHCFETTGAFMHEFAILYLPALISTAMNCLALHAKEYKKEDAMN